tara:strand:+ start:415 stop:624 length:210 start_codon:yes stop_codon:yes gene_type:complete
MNIVFEDGNDHNSGDQSIKTNASKIWAKRLSKQKKQEQIKIEESIKLEIELTEKKLKEEQQRELEEELN